MPASISSAPGKWATTIFELYCLSRTATACPAHRVTDSARYPARSTRRRRTPGCSPLQYGTHPPCTAPRHGCARSIGGASTACSEMVLQSVANGTRTSVHSVGGGEVEERYRHRYLRRNGRGPPAQAEHEEQGRQEPPRCAWQAPRCRAERHRVCVGQPYARVGTTEGILDARTGSPTRTEDSKRARHAEWPRIRHAKVTLAASLSLRNRLSSVLDTQTHRDPRPRSFVARTYHAVISAAARNFARRCSPVSASSRSFLPRAMADSRSHSFGRLSCRRGTPMRPSRSVLCGFTCCWRLLGP